MTSAPGSRIKYNILTDCIYLKKSLMQIMAEINNEGHIATGYFLIVDLRCVDILSLSIQENPAPRIYLSSIARDKLSPRIADFTIDLHHDIQSVKSEMIRIMENLMVNDKNENTPTLATLHADLTPVENMMLKMLSSGHSVNAIAEIQKTPVKTIYSRISSAREKLSVRTTYELLHQISSHNIRF
ncbi:helix-turn-helix transcriptional regulator [Erwinia rhapontici]|uniref:helix-turn-helix transcriptional regulator n=1 Tax=Erwinia rhapontici TaxID=55212 RepID=UPI003BA15F80